MKNELVLIATVGGTPEPIIKSIEHHKPRYVYFIPSPETEHKVDEVINRLGTAPFKFKHQVKTITNHEDIVKTYRICNQLFNELESEGLKAKQIIIDITGGTKVMSAALVLAAADYGCQISYVGGPSRTKNGVGIVQDGSEKTTRNLHPFELIAKSDKERFCLNFNTYRFEAAIDDANKIKAKGGGRLGALFDYMRKFCVGYRDWDMFRYSSCIQDIESGINGIRKLNENGPFEPRYLERFIASVANNVKHLKSIEKDDFSEGLVKELVANACRRAEEGKYDDAVARLYRACEMLAQVGIMELFGHKTKEFPLNSLLPEIRIELFSRDPEDAKKDLGFKKAFQILARMRHKYGLIYAENEEELRSIINVRNDSILAHGTTPITKEKYERLHKIFREAFGIDGSDIKFAKIHPEELMSIGLEKE